MTRLKIRHRLGAAIGSMVFLAACQAIPGEPINDTTLAEKVERTPEPPATIPFTRESPFAAEIYTFLVQDQVVPPEACGTMFLGSSSIRFWFTLEKDFPELDVKNRGFGGSTISQATDYFDLIVTPHKPREIVFYSGENDIAAGATPDEVLQSLEGWMSKKTGALGDVPVYYISIKPSIARIDQFEAQSEANTLISAYADSREDLFFIDVVPSMMDGDQPRNIFINDHLHMQREGYAIWTTTLSAALSDPQRPAASYCDKSE